MRRTAGAVLLGCALAAVQAASAAEAHPDLAAALSRAQLVVAGEVIDVPSFDSSRFTVANVRVANTLKGETVASVAIVERHDLPSSRQLLASGDLVITLLAPARRNSAMAKALPAATYFEIQSPPTGVLATRDKQQFEQTLALVTRLLTAQRNPDKDPTQRLATARTLAFDELAARHPTLVADGIGELQRFPDLASTLTPTEQTRLVAALQRADLPQWIRIALVEAIAKCGLQQLVPTLRQLPQPSPNLQRATWKALTQLGAAPTVDDLRAACRNEDPAMRAAALAALTDALGTKAREPLEELAEDDPDRSVRLAAIDALGRTDQAALPALGRVFSGADWGERRAAGRAITTIGGRPAAETLARLAFDGPPESQKFAVTLLLLTGIAHSDPLVQHIEATHPDESVRHIIESGLEIHEH